MPNTSHSDNRIFLVYYLLVFDRVGFFWFDFVCACFVVSGRGSGFG